MLPRVYTFLIAVLTITASALANAPKVETIGPLADQSASESVRKALEKAGYRVSLADGNALCEVWFRAAVPTQPKKDIAGAIYTEIVESAAIGVISFPKGSTDFRGQGIKPGLYTMRYGLHPADGNHMGVSPIRDFLLLVPVATDQDINTAYRYEELVKLSARTSGTNHPTPLALNYAEAAPATPAVKENDHGHLVLTARLKSQSGSDIPIAITIQGVAEQ